MTHHFNKIAIVGAGAIGGWLGVGLAQAGCQVSVLARGATLAALQHHGLRLGDTTVAVQASNDAQALGPQDLVVLAVKAPALRDVARQVAPLLAPHTVVLTAMNGVPWWFFQGFGGALQGTQLQSIDPDGAIAAGLPARHVVGCVVQASCSVVAPGVIHHHFGNRLTIGEPAGGLSERVQALGALLERAGFAAALSEQIQKDVWYKLWGNMTTNPISAITGATADRILDDPLVLTFANAVMQEAKAVGACLGVVIDQEPLDRNKITRTLGAFKTSMLQDAEAGKPVELDALVGAVCELGQLTGVPTPMTDALLGMARLHARVHGLYPWSDAAA